MSDNEIKLLIDQVIKQNNLIQLVYICLAALISVIISFIISFYQTKAQNLATKQDIEEITKKTEAVRIQSENNILIINHKYDLKYNAILKSLNLIDCYFSHVLALNVKEKPQKQFSTIEEVRKCHNELILTCENSDLLRLFSTIMFKGSEKPPTDMLNQYRNLCRKELGFGNEIALDRDKAWFGTICFDKKSDMNKNE